MLTDLELRRMMIDSINTMHRVGNGETELLDQAIDQASKVNELIEVREVTSLGPNDFNGPYSEPVRHKPYQKQLNHVRRLHLVR